MSIQYLDSEKLYYSFLSGAQEVIRNNHTLNEINVFPVADGDTGSNLSHTMHSIIQEAKIEGSVRDTMNSIADAALTGARGNSGIIIAQYINGIFMSLKDDVNISISSFADMVNGGVPHAYHAIENPVEGTIITVIREWAASINGHKDNARDFHELLSSSMVDAMKSLKETTYKLKVLEDANVVDSGAKGFVYFIEGFTQFLKTGLFSADKSLNQDDVDFAEYPVDDHLEINERYCTEALISGKDMDLDAIRKELSTFGDSLIVAGNSGKVKIHIHTNDPAEIFQHLKTKGTILQQKADDMIRQNEAAYHRKYQIALVTDSIADLPMSFIDEYQIHMMPLNLVFDGSTYLDKVTMTPEIFYPLLDAVEEYPKSAQPNPKAVENFMGSIAAHYDEIIVITVAKAQSGTNSVFQKASEKLQAKGKKISVIDSRQNSGAEGLLVMKAAELIRDGHPFEKITDQINELRSRTKILVSVNTLKYMVRSGRLGKVSGFAGKVMNLKPVVSLDADGKGSIAAKAFSEKSNTDKIIEIMKSDEKEKKITRYAIVHANAEKRAMEMKDRCQSILGFEPQYIMNISTIVGMSAGVGTVAVSYMCEEGDS
ncbi:MAG TPA: DegV family protein [Bacteroidales bacterium]|nr:DegV family protein [Bacteroidales bacterium]